MENKACSKPPTRYDWLVTGYIVLPLIISIKQNMSNNKNNHHITMSVFFSTPLHSHRCFCPFQVPGHNHPHRWHGVAVSVQRGAAAIAKGGAPPLRCVRWFINHEYYIQMLHAWNIYLHLGHLKGKCRQIFHTWSIWALVKSQFLVKSCLVVRVGQITASWISPNWATFLQFLLVKSPFFHCWSNHHVFSGWMYWNWFFVICLVQICFFCYILIHFATEIPVI